MTDFPPQQPAEELTDHEKLQYLVRWAHAMNDWHHEVNVGLARLQERTADLRWLKWGTIVTAALAVAGLVSRWTGHG